MGDRLPRKLVVILYADVAGYSRLTGADEDATHRRLSEYLDLIAVSIESHEGRVMHYAGDAVLAMFDAVVVTLSCATDVQRNLKQRNQNLPDDRKLQFRIGVTAGSLDEPDRFPPNRHNWTSSEISWLHQASYFGRSTSNHSYG